MEVEQRLEPPGRERGAEHIRVELDGWRDLCEEVGVEALEILLLDSLKRGDNIGRQMVAELQAKRAKKQRTV